MPNNLDLRAELGRMLDTYDERRRAVLEREQKVRDEDAAFLAGFAELRRAVVRPVFELAAAMLAERGHQVTIAEQEYAVDTDRKVSEAAISITVVPAGAHVQPRGEEPRTLSVSTRHYNKTVWINAGAQFDSGAGARGSYTLQRIDRDLIEMALVRFIGKLVEA